MKFYKIGPVIIEIENAGDSFQPFLYLNEVDTPDLRVQFLKNPPDLEDVCDLISVNNIQIQKSGRNSLNKKWLFHSRRIQNCKSTITVLGNYKNAFFYSTVTNPAIYYSELEYLLQPVVACIAISKGIVVLHAACIFKDNVAISFSGRSGVGKSTRAYQWMKQFGYEMLSGDRPWIDPLRNLVLGTPWDGKEKIHRNMKIPIAFIFEIKRSTITSICHKSNKETTKFLASQIFVPMWDLNLVAKTFVNLRLLVDTIPCYQLFCNQTERAAIETYHLIVGRLRTDLEDINDMKIKDSFEIVQIDDDYMVVPTNQNLEEYGGTVILNEVSAFLLKHMKTEISQEELLELLLEEYEVSREVAGEDIKNIINTFDELGLIE